MKWNKYQNKAEQKQNVKHKFTNLPHYDKSPKVP